MSGEYTEGLPKITLNLTPHEVGRALEALREGRGMIAGLVADKLAAAAAPHVAILDETGWFEFADREVRFNDMSDVELDEPDGALPTALGSVANALEAMREELSGVRVDLSAFNRAFRQTKRS